jgi:phage gp29-like protein
MNHALNSWFPSGPIGGAQRPSYTHQSAMNINSYLTPLIQGRIKQDIQSWKEALQQAEVPLPLLSYRILMQQMFMDTVLDGHVFACMSKRKNLILLKDFEIVDSEGVVDEVASKILQKRWFGEIINYCLDALFYGYTLIGLGDIVNDNFSHIDLLRRPNVSPDRLNLALMPYSPSGINFMNPEEKDEDGNSFFDWTIYVPTPSDFGISNCGYGLLYRVSLYQILLRNNLGDNATYNELYGQPIRKGKTTKTDKNARAAFESQLANIGSSAWVMLDGEDELDLLAAGSAGKGNETYAKFEERLNKTITKIILGHADAIESTPGKLGSQGKEEDGAGKALGEVEKHDTAFIESVVNDTIIPKLIKLGIKIPYGKRFRVKNDREKEDSRKRADANNQVFIENVKTLFDSGLTVEPEYIAETTGYKVAKSEEPEPIEVEKEIPDEEEIKHSKKINSQLNSLYGHHH